MTILNLQFLKILPFVEVFEGDLVHIMIILIMDAVLLMHTNNIIVSVNSVHEEK